MPKAISGKLLISFGCCRQEGQVGTCDTARMWALPRYPMARASSIRRSGTEWLGMEWECHERGCGHGPGHDLSWIGSYPAGEGPVAGGAVPPRSHVNELLSFT